MSRLPRAASARSHRRRGYPARHRRHLHARLRQPGHGLRRRGHLPDLQLASKMKDQRGPAGGGEKQARRRRAIKRFIAKYTINAARTFGIDAFIGSLEPARSPTWCLWRPGFSASSRNHGERRLHPGAPMGDSAAKPDDLRAVRMRPQWGASAGQAGALSVWFLSIRSRSRPTSRGSLDLAETRLLPAGRGSSRSTICAQRCLPESGSIRRPSTSTSTARSRPASPPRVLRLAQKYMLR